MRDINLLPEDSKAASKENILKEAVEGAKEKKAGRTLVKAVMLVVVIATLIAATLAAPRVYMGELDAAAAELDRTVNDPKYNETNLVNRQLAIVNGQLELKREVLKDIDAKSHPLTEIFTSLRNACPRGCYITGLDFDGGKVRVSGAASDAMLAAEFMSNLDSLEHLEREGSSDSLAVAEFNASVQYSFTYNIGGGGGK
jgi:Tfp pilus assembly protein PilN